jgi:hypothetical protein
MQKKVVPTIVPELLIPLRTVVVAPGKSIGMNSPPVYIEKMPVSIGWILYFETEKDLFSEVFILLNPDRRLAM